MFLVIFSFLAPSQAFYLHSLLMNYWLVKSEPSAYSWTDFLKDDGTDWTGVRNYQARNNLNLMRPGDPVLFYHSVTNPQVVGLAEVAALAAPDGTAAAGSPWMAVALRPVRALAEPVPLAALKADERLSQLALLRQSRLSVVPVRPEEFDIILELARMV